VNSVTDQQLLGDYAERRSEAAFAELVRRHVDLVYSAAVRMVCDAHLAEDVSQAVFVALAQNARQLTDRPVLSGWLHRTAQNLAAKAVRSDVRRRAREQEAAAMNPLLSPEPEAVWIRERTSRAVGAAGGWLRRSKPWTLSMTNDG
jgi:DNA-directed RNA polymerase specialized sigma24 family protein